MSKTSNGKQNRLARALKDCPVKWYDILILLLLSGFCFLSYEMRDLYHTAGCSYGFLDGHFLDFYDYLAASGIGEDGTVGLHASYLPTIYMLFAVWNLPMKLFGIVPHASASLGFVPIMWAKLLPCLSYFASGIVFYQVTRELGFEEKKAKVSTYAYLTVPIALFSQFIIGQYEIFTVIFILLGFLSWLRKKDFRFILFFGIAMTLKFYAVLLFIPLLMLREKNIWKILLKCVCMLLPTVIEILIFAKSPAFRLYAFGLGGSGGDNPTGYISNALYFTGFEGVNGKAFVYLSVIAFALTCGYAYFKHCDSEGEKRYSVYIATLSMSLFFGFVKWHPQWLMLMLPFYVLSAFMHKNTKVFLFLELLMSVFFTMFVVQAFSTVTDEVMIANGIFKYILPGGKVLPGVGMTEYLAKLPESMLLSLITAVMFVYAVFTHPKFYADQTAVLSDKVMGIIRARYILGLLMFIIPSILCIYQSVSGLHAVYLEDRRNVLVTMTDETVASQEFTANEDGNLKRLLFPVLFENGEEGSVMVTVSDSSGTILYEEEVPASDLNIQKLTLLKPEIPLQKGASYTVSLSSSGAEEMGLSFYGSETESSYAEAVVDGNQMNYHLELYLYR